MNKRSLAKFILICTLTALALAAPYAAKEVLSQAAPGADLFAQPAYAAEPADQEKDRPAFEKTWPHLDLEHCRSTRVNVRLAWWSVYGATGYEVYRSARLKGPYEKFGETTELKLKQDADGFYYYKVRAVRGDKKSQWSRPVRLFCQSGYIERMYDDSQGHTHFVVRISNQSGQDAYFYGRGRYNGGQGAEYTVKKFTIQDGVTSNLGDPFPMKAEFTGPVYGAAIVKSGEEGTVDVSVPTKLDRFGENGFDGPDGGYKVSLTFYPNMQAPAYTLTAGANYKKSRLRGRGFLRQAEQ